MLQQLNQSEESRQLPIAKNEDVEFSWDAADEDDREAVERAEKADSRQENGKP